MSTQSRVIPIQRKSGQTRPIQSTKLMACKAAGLLKPFLETDLILSAFKQRNQRQPGFESGPCSARSSPGNIPPAIPLPSTIHLARQYAFARLLIPKATTWTQTRILQPPCFKSAVTERRLRISEVGLRQRGWTLLERINRAKLI